MTQHERDDRAQLAEALRLANARSNRLEREFRRFAAAAFMAATIIAIVMCWFGFLVGSQTWRQF